MGGRVALHEVGYRQHHAGVAGIPVFAEDGKSRVIPLADKGFRLFHQLGGKHGGGTGGKTAHDQHDYAPYGQQKKRPHDEAPFHEQLGKRVISIAHDKVHGVGQGGK